MKLSLFVAVAFLGVSLSAATLAQPAQQASGPGAGPGQNNKAAGFGWSNSNTTGWSLMTPEERAVHQNKMRAVTTYDECKTLLEENHKAMEVRAKEKGVKLPAPRQNGCNVLKARGLIK